MIPVWAYVAGGAALLALCWRVGTRLRVQLRFRAALRSPSVTARRAAVRECVAIGVTETARMLVRVIRRESSTAVLDELLIALAERQWEPASRADVIELRIWARGYALDHPGVLASGGAAPPASGESRSDGDEITGAVPAATAGASPATSQPGERSAVSEVAPTTVLVAGSGSPAAIATISALRGLGHRVIAVDDDPLSSGLLLADVGQALPPPEQPTFGVCVLQAARRHGATALICPRAEWQAELGKIAEELTAAGIRCAFPRPDALQACLDKGHLYRTLRDNGLPAPAADPGAGGAPAADMTSPDGRAADEFSADALVAFDGQISAVVTHRRLETVGEMSIRAETFRDDRIADLCLRAVKVMRLTGPASLRGSLTSQSEVMLTDVQPYFSADLPLSLHAGADLTGQHLRQVFGLPIIAERLAWRAAVVMKRDFRETFEE